MKPVLCKLPAAARNLPAACHVWMLTLLVLVSRTCSNERKPSSRATRLELARVRAVLGRFSGSSPYWSLSATRLSTIVGADCKCISESGKPCFASELSFLSVGDQVMPTTRSLSARFRCISRCISTVPKSTTPIRGGGSLTRMSAISNWSEVSRRLTTATPSGANPKTCQGRVFLVFSVSCSFKKKAVHVFSSLLHQCAPTHQDACN